MVFKYNPQHHVITKMKGGKQGLVGMILDKSNKNIKIYKFSSNLNMLATHEYNIMSSLKTINHITPYFTSCYELVNIPVNQNFKEDDNPFELKTKYKYLVDVCISEYVENARKLTSFIRHSKQVCDNIIVSIIKQILISLLMAHNSCNFTHYDIHSENIFVQKCSYNDVFVWYDKTNSIPYVIPSLGYLPRIIDYGFSYSDGVKGTNITSPLDFMREGYFSIHPDKFVDFKIFLISILEDLYHYRSKGYLFTYLRRIVKKIYKDTDVDWESGWFVDKKSSASKFLYEHMANNEKYLQLINSSPTIEEHFYSILEYFQLLIKTPLDSDPLPDKSMPELFEEFVFGFKEFLKHFIKLEHLFEDNNKKENEYETNPDMGLYIIRQSIQFIIQTREEYLNEATTKSAVRKFQNLLFESICSNKKLHFPKINYEKYIASIYIMVNVFHSLLYREYKYRCQFVENQYATLPVDNSNDILYIINHYLDVPYHYTTDTRLIVMDEFKKVSSAFNLTQDQCNQINETKEVVDRNKVIYEFIQNSDPKQTTTNSISVRTMLYSDEQKIDSPNNKVGMGSWSPSDDEECDSDDEEYDVKYDWSIDSIEKTMEKLTIETYGETSESGSDDSGESGSDDSGESCSEDYESENEEE
jgi:hypothetical protein